MDARPRPLECVADATKQKLNAFNFRPPAQALEPEEPAKRELADENDNLAEPDAASLPPSVPLAPTKHLSTPVSRLAWQDLIGDSDVNPEDEDASPQEKIEWDTQQKPMYGMSPMPRKRGSKRARSSSPVSSPATARTVTPAVNVKKLSAALKSPHADPAIELWDRFSLSGSTATTPLAAANPAFAQIMVSSSPQPPQYTGAGRGDGGLRRAISCGANWPKRRRVERTETTRSTGNTAGESPRNNSKSSMVNALLKSVTGELNRSKAAQTQRNVLKSPSPRKRQYNPASNLSGSPTRRLSPAKSPMVQTSAAADMSNEASNIDASSDYGDDDFDDDTLMNLDVSIGSALEQDSHPPPPQSPDRSQTINHDSIIPKADTMLDDFADLDDDLFADAGDLLTQIDSACNSVKGVNVSQAPVSASTGSQQPTYGESAEDMYGDDFGDFDFEAAELAATQQSTKKPTGSVPLVRKSSP